MKKLALLLLGAALVGGLLYRAALSQAPVECEACMAWADRRACGTVAAESRDEASRRAIAYACGILTSGVTASLACERGRPLSLECRER